MQQKNAKRAQKRQKSAKEVLKCQNSTKSTKKCKKVLSVKRGGFHNIGATHQHIEKFSVSCMRDYFF